MGELSITATEASGSQGTTPTTGEAPPDGQPVLEWDLSPIKQFSFSWTPIVAGHYQLMESPGPGEPYVQVGEDLAADATQVTITVPLHARLNASYALRACNGMACTESEPVQVSGSLAEAIGYVKASNPDASDNFGANLAISGDGDTLAVSALFESSSATGVGGDQASNSLPGSGAVYVYTRAGATWSQQAYIKASNTDQEDQFGASVALSHDGDTLAVGAHWDDSLAVGIDGDQGNHTYNPGSVYVFQRTGESWAQQAYVKASNADGSDQFGIDLALSGDGNTLAVGAFGEDSSAAGVGGNQNDKSASESGAVYVFTRDASTWSQQAYIKASNTSAHAYFGVDLALDASGDTLAVGSWFESSNATGVGGDQGNTAAPDSGAVYVYTRTGGTWSHQAYVKASNTSPGDWFGDGIALSGDGKTMAIGAPNEDSNATGIDGDQANDAAIDAGAVYVFRRDADSWAQEAYVKSSNIGPGDLFGTAVQLSADGNIMAVAGLLEDSRATGVGGDQADDLAPDAGAVYVFRRAGEAWSQQAYVKAPNTHADDRFGSIALSADASTMAVGAWVESSHSAGVGGDQTDLSAPGAGAVYLY